MKDKSKANWGRVVILAGAIIAFTIGSGFATGQEIIQYFTAYGLKGILTVLLFAVCFIYYNYNFAKAGAEEHFERGNDVYKFYCGKYVGSFMDYYSTLFCYMSFFVMVGGAASTLRQQYGLPNWLGGVILAGLSILTVVGGLNSLVDKIGIVGPAIVILCISIGLITLFRDSGNVSAGLEVIRTGAFAQAGEETIKNAGANWVISGLSYAGFVLLWFASFTAALGARNKKKDIEYGIYGGTIAVCVAIVLVMLAQIANINTAGLASEGTFVWNADIPNLILAGRIWKPLASVFAVVVFAGIYTSAVPLLYNPCARFAKEGTSKFKILTVILGVVGLLVGLYLPFRVLVNVIYVLNGYVGAVLILFMLWKNIKDVFLKKKR
ncbi:hypothetical protein GCM10008910_00050 [Faecalicatena orotica]|uniref:Putative membrane protein YkvI n=1 Tax=Faecalicatena orotica TaxID=1544 RepID=A0A2Y9C6V2_9FIRM|nr:hypothetical protein [Faecalicatena orotica]PWJ17638.1 putative membrane protein YkvI [Faecalicatena orotica]SSA58795.1 Uncharacterized membrane protein YkvI [Faecalicatena orotica]